MSPFALNVIFLTPITIYRRTTCLNQSSYVYDDYHRLTCSLYTGDQPVLTKVCLATIVGRCRPTYFLTQPNKTTNLRLTFYHVHYQPWYQLIPRHKRDGVVRSASTVCQAGGAGDIPNTRKARANKFTAVGNLATVIPTITIRTFSTETDTELNIKRG